jgi:hypothetical protein
MIHITVLKSEHKIKTNIQETQEKIFTLSLCSGHQTDEILQNSLDRVRIAIGQSALHILQPDPQNCSTTILVFPVWQI